MRGYGAMQPWIQQENSCDHSKALKLIGLEIKSLNFTEQNWLGIC